MEVLFLDYSTQLLFWLSWKAPWNPLQNWDVLEPVLSSNAARHSCSLGMTDDSAAQHWLLIWRALNTLAKKDPFLGPKHWMQLMEKQGDQQVKHKGRFSPPKTVPVPNALSYLSLNTWSVSCLHSSQLQIISENSLTRDNRMAPFTRNIILQQGIFILWRFSCSSREETLGASLWREMSPKKMFLPARGIPEASKLV